jgi:glycerol-3-phosphate acyltransferase PlsY
LRTSGRAAGVITLLLEIGKGYLAVWIAGRFTASDPWWMAAAALAVMAGHAYPIFLGFRGGKAAASFIGSFLCLAPGAMVCALLVFIGVVAWTRHISMGSVIAAATFPLAVWIVQHSLLPVLLASLIAAAFVVYRHGSNIRRLHSGTEHQFTFGGRR